MYVHGGDHEAEGCLNDTQVFNFFVGFAELSMIISVADGERVFFVSNPAIGLWSTRARFNSDPATQE
jgi:hypothetical protein